LGTLGAKEYETEMNKQKRSEGDKGRLRKMEKKRNIKRRK
jgi:hypothetical protein